MSGFSAATIRALRRRSRGICEGCGVAQAVQAHHRQYRSRGGSDELSNALHLCGSGNHTGCHGVAHTGEGEALGWSIRSGFNPLLVPARVVVDFVEVWHRLADVGAHPLLMSEVDAVAYLVSINAREATT